LRITKKAPTARIVNSQEVTSMNKGNFGQILELSRKKYEYDNHSKTEQESLNIRLTNSKFV